MIKPAKRPLTEIEVDLALLNWERYGLPASALGAAAKILQTLLENAQKKAMQARPQIPGLTVHFTELATWYGASDRASSNRLVKRLEQEKLLENFGRVEGESGVYRLLIRSAREAAALRRGCSLAELPAPIRMDWPLSVLRSPDLIADAKLAYFFFWHRAGRVPGVVETTALELCDFVGRMQERNIRKWFQLYLQPLGLAELEFDRHHVLRVRVHHPRKMKSCAET